MRESSKHALAFRLLPKLSPLFRRDPLFPRSLTSELDQQHCVVHDFFGNFRPSCPRWLWDFHGKRLELRHERGKGGVDAEPGEKFVQGVSRWSLVWGLHVPAHLGYEEVHHTRKWRLGRGRRRAWAVIQATAPSGGCSLQKHDGKDKVGDENCYYWARNICKTNKRHKRAERMEQWSCDNGRKCGAVPKYKARSLPRILMRVETSPKPGYGRVSSAASTGHNSLKLQMQMQE